MSRYSGNWDTKVWRKPSTPLPAKAAHSLFIACNTLLVYLKNGCKAPVPAANRLGRNFQLQPKWAPSIKHRKRNCHLSRVKTLPTGSSHQGALTAALNPQPYITGLSDSPLTSTGMAKAGAGWAKDCPAPGTGWSSRPNFPPENLCGIYFWLYFAFTDSFCKLLLATLSLCGFGSCITF